MKKLFLILCLFIGFTASAQIINFRTTAYAQKINNYGTWTDWSNYQPSDMLVTIDLYNDVVTINSPKTQVYAIYESLGNYYDSDGDYNMVFRFIDQDYDYGIMRLLQRVSGYSEIYIEFSNIMWVYRVRRL